MSQKLVPAGTIAEIRNYQPFSVTHRHSYHQFILPIAGTLELEIEGKFGKAQALWGVAVPSNWTHSYRGISSNSFVVIDLPVAEHYGTLPRDALEHFLENQTFFPIDRSLYYYSHFIATEISNTNHSREVLDQIAYLLLNLLITRTQENDSSKSFTYLLPALTYMNENYHKPIFVSKLAKLCNLSVSRFYTLFKEFTGKPPKQYLTNIRLTKALQLLEEGRFTVGEIALEVGYSNQVAFNHAFKKWLKTSPKKYTKK